jgi:hypothetical protein
MIEIWGISGSLLHYAFTFASMCTALIVFIYFWKKGRLDFDEEPKMQMLQNDDIGDDDESRT